MDFCFFEKRPRAIPVQLSGHHNKIANAANASGKAGKAQAKRAKQGKGAKGQSGKQKRDQRTNETNETRADKETSYRNIGAILETSETRPDLDTTMPTITLCWSPIPGYSWGSSTRPCGQNATYIFVCCTTSVLCVVNSKSSDN